MTSTRRDLGPTWTKPLALAVILASLASFAYWLEYTKRPADQARAEDEGKVFALAEKRIAKLEIVSTEGQPVVLTCSDMQSGLCRPGDNSQWAMTSPIKSRADAGNSNALITSLNTMNATSTIDLSTDTPEKRAELLREYGLGATLLSTAEQAQVTLNDGTTIRAYFGNKHPVGEGTFAVVALNGVLQDKRVFVVNPGSMSSLRRPVSHWRDKRIMTMPESDVKTLEFARRSGEIVRAERKSTGWELSSGKVSGVPADTDALSSLLSSATYLIAKDFAEESKTSPAAKKILAHTQRVYRIRLNDGSKSQTLELHEKTFRDGKRTATQLFATVDDLDPLYEVDTMAIDRLDQSVENLRQLKLITTMQRFGTKAVSIEKKGADAYRVRLENSAGVWKGETDLKLDQSRVQALLDRFAQNRVVQRFVSPVPAGSDQGLEIELSNGKDPAHTKLVIWKKGATVLARSLDSTRAEALELDPALGALLPWKKETLGQPAAASAPNTAPGAAGAHAPGHSPHDGHAH